MGKGAGLCFSSPAADQPVSQPSAAPANGSQKPASVPLASKPAAQTIATAPASSNIMAVKIAVIYYSTWGHMKKLVDKVAEGLRAVDGVEVTVFQVPETLSAEILQKMHAPPKADDPVITPAQLPEFDGFVFGVPTRYGRAVAQMSAFFDATGSLWQAGALVGKPATILTSSGTQNGGIETTALTTLPFFVHHGIIYVPHGYTNPAVFSFDEIRAASPWGAATYAGADGSRQPSELELSNAKHQGTYFAGVAKKLAGAK